MAAFEALLHRNREFGADFIGGIFRQLAIHNRQVFPGNLIYGRPFQLQRTLEPWFGRSEVAELDEMLTDAGHSDITVRIERFSSGKVRVRFPMTLHPIEAPAVAQEIISIPRVKFHSPFEPLHGFAGQLEEIFAPFKTLNAISFANCIGGIEVIWFDSEGLL